MSNVTPFTGGMPANVEAIANLKKVARSEAPSASSMPYLRLVSGEWVYGAESTEVEEGSEWAVHPGSFMYGLVCWDDGALMGEAMVNVSHPKPLRSEMMDHGVTWDDQVACVLACVSGEDKGVNVMYKTSSRGGKTAWSKIAEAIATQAEEDPTKIVPIVTLGSDSYKHPKYGKTYTPEIEIVRWVSFDAPDEDAPKKTRKAKAVEEEKEETPAPRRRRGR
jgi:hypothetical protein